MINLLSPVLWSLLTTFIALVWFGLFVCNFSLGSNSEQYSYFTCQCFGLLVHKNTTEVYRASLHAPQQAFI